VGHELTCALHISSDTGIIQASRGLQMLRPNALKKLSTVNAVWVGWVDGSVSDGTM